MNATTDASHAVDATRTSRRGAVAAAGKLAPAGYVAACVVVSLIAVSMLKETADKPID